MTTRPIGEWMDEAHGCTTKEQAAELLERMVNEALGANPKMLREEARALVLSNLGYMTGYIGRTEAYRLLELFGARHPFFGGPGEWPEDPEEILAMGYQWGRRA